tara:strand:- start:1053 stop:2024 length:972 start_codon:yes stop_codon:yes gene_type:complete
MERKIHFFRDLRSTFLLYKFFRKETISVVYTVSPKAGLIGMMVSKFMRIPTRIHTFTGQVWQTKKGVYRNFLRILDKLIFFCSSKVIVDSSSQRQFLIDNNVLNEKKSIVIGHGSLCGIDIEKFIPNYQIRESLRESLGVSQKSIVFLFIGRLDVEKGIMELIEAYSKIENKEIETSLWLVGPNEIPINTVKNFATSLGINSIIFLPYTDIPQNYMASADIFCLPSFREGFGSVIIESASCGIPSIGSEISGLTDSIVNGKTGYLVKVGDIKDLSEKMSLLALDDVLRNNLGNSAKFRAHQFFDERLVIKGLMDFIDEEVRKV